MPRRQFISDLQQASEPGKFPYLTNVTAGEDDGSITCTFEATGSSTNPIDIALLLTDISDYPNGHGWFVYTTTTDDVPAEATDALESLQDEVSGLSITATLLHLADTLKKSLNGSQSDDNSVLEYPSDAPDVDDFSDSEEESQDENDDYLDGEDEWFGQFPSVPKASLSDNTKDGSGDSELASRLAGDLTQAKLAGFKVGYVGNREAPIVCVSCRIAKLGISDEAMEAWRVDPQQYLVLLIRYIGRYRPLDEILLADERFGKPQIDLHVDLCDSYKPSYSSAISTFNEDLKTPIMGADADAGPASHHDSNTNKSGKITQSFVSKPLNSLLRDRFVKILKYRYSYGFCWESAERFFNDFQGKTASSAQPDERYLSDEDSNSDSSAVLPPLVTSDHLMDACGPHKSFPLIGMQFVLRHFARCTEFCLVCHCKTNHAFEALKPYVCSKNLCLFQYMSLGFGPSLEWEIISQPYVVDLLISFTYASAKLGSLSDFPTGLGFLVPNENIAPPPSQRNRGLPAQQDAAKPTPREREYKARLDRDSMELICRPKGASEPYISPGDWIVFNNPNDASTDLHCRVRDSSLWPTIRLSPPVRRTHHTHVYPQDKPGDATRQPPAPCAIPPIVDITFDVYDTNFDELSPGLQRQAIATLLDTLPTVDEMKSFVSGPTKPTLASWHDRISKSALDVLRWVVASNRSCIIQEDTDRPIRDGRVYGMDNYVQFRFAQGAPDKEQRFIQSVEDAKVKYNLTYPTIFTWHGSQLRNWHGIVREGLHYRDIVNGRSCGNGVYMSSDFYVSNGFSNAPAFHRPDVVWSRSKLKAVSAISLNEVVNLPRKFVCTSPHFVVSQLDWIQTRYLFVQCSDKDVPLSLAGTMPTEYYKQDPANPAYGPTGNAILIPMTVFSQQRRMTMNSALTADSRPGNDFTITAPSGNAESSSERKSTGLHDKQPDSQLGSQLDGDGDLSLDSDDTENEDLVVLFPPKEEKQGKEKERAQCPPQSASVDSSKTDYVPGTLDGGSLPLLGPPTYATPGASKALQRELKSTLQIQESQPLHELGWYVDPSLINTVYQWIVELHSFESNLPIAKDLRKAGLKSVVLEIRFPKDYPISPPFVRVIRPRFLGFQHGGGGHVTLGGALCMELLTNSGWSAVANMESVLLQVRMAVSSTHPQPARLEPGQDAKGGTVRYYDIGEAVSAYVRACQAHGWEVPEDFRHGGVGLWDAGAK